MRAKTYLTGSLALGILLVGAQAAAKTIYVSGTGDDHRDGAAPSTALRTITAAAAKTAPGDTVEVDDGVYDAFSVKISGAEGAWIRYVAKAGARPKVQFTGWNGIFLDAAHHIEIRGFEVAGPMASRTLDACTADADAATPDPLCNGNGISIDARKVTPKAHHILIANNDVHDCPGGGISAIEGDYVTVEKNFVHGNALHTRYGASGISFLTPYNSDDTTGVKMIVRQNRVFGNKTLVKWAKIQKLSDGNGIIIDTTRNTGTDPPIIAYKGRTLVENNVSVGNGGSGVHAYDSEHVDILHNTTYQNGQVVGYAEIFANNSTDVRIINNIMVGRAAGDVNTKDTRSNAEYSSNIYFGGTVRTTGVGDVVADPQIVFATLDPATANFRVAKASPAVDTASMKLTSPVDITGASRPVGVGPDRGAYELGATAPPADAASDAGVDDDGGKGTANMPTGVADAGVQHGDDASAPSGGTAGALDDAGGGAGGCRAAAGSGESPVGLLWAAALAFAAIGARRRARG